MILFDNLSSKTQEILTRKSKVTGTNPSDCMFIFEEEIIHIVDSINLLPGLITNESCGGHPERKLFPFVNFTITDKENGLTNLAYIIQGAYKNNWGVICNSDRPGSTEGIFYSFLLLPQTAMHYDKNYVQYNSEPTFIPYRNNASNSKDVEDSQKTIIKLSETIKKLYNNVKVAGLTESRLRV
jgi:hypothetical protein